MIYIKGMNPTKNKTVYFRGYFSNTSSLWTENLNQAVDVKTTNNAQTIINNINSMNRSINNLSYVNDNKIHVELFNINILDLLLGRPNYHSNPNANGKKHVSF